MKKLVIILIALLFSVTAWSQGNPTCTDVFKLEVRCPDTRMLTTGEYSLDIGWIEAGETKDFSSAGFLDFSFGFWGDDGQFTAKISRTDDGGTVGSNPALTINQTMNIYQMAGASAIDLDNPSFILYTFTNQTNCNAAGWVRITLGKITADPFMTADDYTITYTCEYANN